MSPLESLTLFSGVLGKICKNGFVTASVKSGYLNSAQESTGKTTSAYSHEAVHHHSLTTIASIFGRVFITTSLCHFIFPNIEFPFANHMNFVGVGICVLPVKSLFPTL